MFGQEVRMESLFHDGSVHIPGNRKPHLEKDRGAHINDLDIFEFAVWKTIWPVNKKDTLVSVHPICSPAVFFVSDKNFVLDRSALNPLTRDVVFRLPGHQLDIRQLLIVRTVKCIFPGQHIFKYGGLSSIDWSKTTAFLAEEECIRMNVRGVYPQGILDEKDYSQCRTEIIRKLKALKDPETQETVFENVLSREDAFDGSDDKELPDIKLMTREAKYDITGKWFQDGTVQDNIFVRNEKHSRGANGMHRYEGVFFINGPYCLPHTELKNIKIIDVCPTILFQMGLPISRDMDGTIMEEAFHSDFLTKHSICYEDTVEGVGTRVAQPVYSAQDESKIVDHLRSLGYI